MNSGRDENVLGEMGRVVRDGTVSANESYPGNYRISKATAVRAVFSIEVLSYACVSRRMELVHFQILSSDSFIMEDIYFGTFILFELSCL